MTNLKLITTEKFGDLDCNFYRNMNDDILLTREQIGTALEYSNPDSALSMIHKRHKDRLDTLSVIAKVKAKDGKFYNSVLYTVDGALLICSLSKQPNSIILAEFIKSISGDDNIRIITTRKETDFISALEQFLLPFKIKGIKQYKILDYRIDYYIPDINVAIEYDENEHVGYTYEQQEKRQQLLENKLDCLFIRLNDQKSDLENIGIVAKEICNFIY